MDINMLVAQILEDKKYERTILGRCTNNAEDYFYDHYDGYISESILYDYCQHARCNRHARDILKQIIRYCNTDSLSSRVFMEISRLPHKDFETCCHHLAHCPLSFLQKYNIFLNFHLSELLIDLLECICLQQCFVENDLRYLLTYIKKEDCDTIRYFMGTFDEKTNSKTKHKLDIINTWIVENCGIQ